MKVLISGGGTGGHIYPAVAIANKIKDENKDVQILFVGTKKGLESEIVPKCGYEIKTVTVEGFKRKITLDNAKRVLKLFKGMEESRRILKDFKPDVVIGTGGYVCGPVVFNAAIRGIPTVIHEQNAFPGITNKILSRVVSKVLISFEDAKKYFKNEEKVVFTGNPVRKEILSTQKFQARKKLGIAESKKVVLSMGGSGGSKKLNDAMKPLIKEFVKEGIQFIHVTGKSHYDEFIKDMDLDEFKGCQRILAYLDDIPNALAASDLVICSSGAITLAEITSLGRASIVIPKAHTAENHQEFNARSIENAKAGICILEKDLTFEKLNKVVFSILGDREKIKSMSKNSKDIGRPMALSLIYKEIMDVIK